jgi:hypothetical protein
MGCGAGEDMVMIGSEHKEYEGDDASFLWWLPNPLEVTLLVTFWCLTRQVSACDLWWHLVAGRDCWQTASIPRVDHLSLVSDGWPWMNPSWLWDTVAWLVVDRAGLGFLLGLKGFCACLTLWLIVRLSWESGGAGKWPLVAAIAVGVTSLNSQFWNLRPQLMTPLLSATFLLLLRRFELHRPTELALLVPLMVLWANTHAGFALGLALIGAVLAGQAFCWLRGDPGSQRRVELLCGLLLAATVATGLNPYGTELLTYPLFHQGNATLSARISEWLPTVFTQEPALCGSLLLLLVLFLRRPFPLIAPSEPILVAAALHLIRAAVRHIFVLGALIAPSVAARMPSIQQLERFPRTAPAWFLILCWLLLFWGQRDVPSLPDFYPERATAWLQSARAPGNGYNQFELGGYLLYHLPAGYRPFIDGRVDTHIQSGGFQRYLTVWDAQPGWQRILARYRIRWALINPGCRLAKVLRQNHWVEKIKEKNWSLFLSPKAGS